MTTVYQDDTDTDWDSAYDEDPEDDDQHNSLHSAHRQAPQATPSAKAREASNEAASASRTVSNQPPASRDSIRAAYDEVSPLLDSEPPPPAYADVTAGRPYTGALASSSGNSNTHINNDMANAGNRAGAPTQDYGSISAPSATVQSERQPEGMGGSYYASTTADAESGRRGSSQHSGKRKIFRRHMKRKILWGGIMWILIFAILALIARTTFNDTHDDDNGSRDGRTPSPMIPPNATFPDPRHSLDCPFEYYSDSFFYKFESPQNFQFVELLEESTHLSGGIGGQVRITSPLEGQTAAIVVGLGIATTAPWYVSQVNIKQGPESLYLKAPTLLKKGRASARKPCMGIYVTIFVRPDIKLSSFEIATENLDLTVEAAAFDISQRHDADEIYISNTTDFTVLSGDVSVAYWASRETRIDVTSGSVSGHYALYDLLSVKTRSGSISISVEPKPADKTSPHSADFTASSMSGSVSVHFQTGRFEDEIPDREYRTHVETKSGSISGFYIHGLSSTFRTMSSSIQVKLLPYTPDAYASTLRTETNSGHTHVELLPSYKQPEIPIARMHSVHKSKSSSLSLVYPQQWVGVIDGETVSAHISLRGKDVEITKSYKGPVGTHIIAKKGSGGSRLGMSTISGSIDALLGDN